MADKRGDEGGKAAGKSAKAPRATTRREESDAPAPKAATASAKRLSVIWLRESGRKTEKD